MSNYINHIDGVTQPETETFEAVRIQAIYRGRKGRQSIADIRQVSSSSTAWKLPKADEITASVTDEVWDERILGVRIAYVDSCKRLGVALEGLEQTLCTMTGETYSAEEPILHVRAHMSKKVETYAQGNH